MFLNEIKYGIDRITERKIKYYELYQQITLIIKKLQT
jgi:hypothetical protein